MAELAFDALSRGLRIFTRPHMMDLVAPGAAERVDLGIAAGKLTTPYCNCQDHLLM